MDTTGCPENGARRVPGGRFARGWAEPRRLNDDDDDDDDMGMSRGRSPPRNPRGRILHGNRKAQPQSISIRWTLQNVAWKMVIGTSRNRRRECRPSRSTVNPFGHSRMEQVQC